MVAPVAFPIAKLGVLLFKQISKPLARRISKNAENIKVLREYVVIPTGQMFHYLEVKLKMASLDLRLRGKVTKVPKLSKKDAIEHGSTILSEMLILCTAIGVLVYEYRKGQEEKIEEENQKRDDREMLKNKLFELETSIDNHSNNIHSLAKVYLKQTLSLTDNEKYKEYLSTIISDETDSNKADVKELHLLQDTEIKSSSKVSKKTSEEDKTITEEFVDFVEEVIEEVMEAVEDDD